MNKKIRTLAIIIILALLIPYTTVNAVSTKTDEVIEELNSSDILKSNNGTAKYEDNNIEIEAITELLEDKIEEKTLRKILDEKVKEFLLLLYSDKNSYKDFFNEVFSTTDYVLLFAKYYLKLYDYRLNNSYIC